MRNLARLQGACVKNATVYCLGGNRKAATGSSFVLSGLACATPCHIVTHETAELEPQVPRPNPQLQLQGTSERWQPNLLLLAATSPAVGPVTAGLGASPLSHRASCSGAAFAATSTGGEVAAARGVEEALQAELPQLARYEGAELAAQEAPRLQPPSQQAQLPSQLSWPASFPWAGEAF